MIGVAAGVKRRMRSDGPRRPCRSRCRPAGCSCHCWPRQAATLVCNSPLTVDSSSLTDCNSSLEVSSSSLVDCNSSLTDCISSLDGFQFFVGGFQFLVVGCRYSSLARSSCWSASDASRSAAARFGMRRGGLARLGSGSGARGKRCFLQKTRYRSVAGVHQPDRADGQVDGGEVAVGFDAQPWAHNDLAGDGNFVQC
jgi:hypothetical protein